MRIAILGGTGFIGAHVATRLIQLNHHVAVIHRGHRPVPAGAVSLLADRAASAEAWGPFQPDALIDMIAYSLADLAPLADRLTPPLRRVTLISSGDVYATYGAFLRQEPLPPGTRIPASETAPLRTTRFPYRTTVRRPDDMRYHYDKILVEEAYRSGSRVPVTVLRLPMVYGPNDPHRRLAQELARLRAAPGECLGLSPQEASWQCTRGYVEDVAAAVALATTHPNALGQTYNIGEPEALSTRTWLQAVAELGCPTTVVREDPMAASSEPVDWTIPLTVDTSQIRAALGYVEPVGRYEGLRRTVTAAAA
jgi:nucleoside-diphosphate-sugar epimerase